MNEIITLTQCLAPYLSRTTLNQLHVILVALLSMSGRVTMLGISRWTEGGGSYRSIQRFYQSRIAWVELHWTLIKAHVLKSGKVYLLAGDEVVVSKAGKKTYGVGKFYSSLAQRPIPAISFLALSLVDVEQRRAYPLQVEQRLPAQATAAAPKPKRPPGRPQGGKNHAKAAPTLNAELMLLGQMLRATRQRIAPLVVKYMVLDGAFGNYPTTWLVQDCGFHLISKLRANAALYLPYAGPKPPRGPMPRYGDKLDYAQLPADRLISSVCEGDYRVDTYHLHAYHKDFADLLNLVVLLKTHLKSGKRAHVILFSTDLALSPHCLIDYYSLRFQIEFTFRDAKQFWGLEDFMNVSPTAVTNAANLAFLMVNLSASLLAPYRLHQPDFSILDLKAHFRARRYLTETINSLPDPPAPDFISRLWRRFSALGGIRIPPPHQDAA